MPVNAQFINYIQFSSRKEKALAQVGLLLSRGKLLRTQEEKKSIFCK